MKIEELTWADIQAILVIDEKIMLEKLRCDFTMASLRST